jgi:hypothetical protein
MERGGGGGGGGGGVAQMMLECLSRTEENSRDGFSILKALRRRFFFNDFNGGRKEVAMLLEKERKLR